MRTETLRLHDDRDDVTLTTYVLDDSPELLAGAPRPAVLVLPGGAYLGCSDREGEPVALAFAALGYHAFVLRYSTYGAVPSGVDPATVVEPKDHCRHPGPLRDVALAVLRIKERAAGWHLDPDRLALCGFSAGGHNAAMYGTHWHRPLLTEALGVDAAALRPAALVLGYALTDYVRLEEWVEPADEGVRQVMRAAHVALLGTATPDAATELALSPARHVGPSTPPSFLWHTAADALVPARHSLAFAAALADAGVPFELHVHERGGHGLALATAATAGSATQVDDVAAGWFGACARWLEQRLALPVP
ncbi:alpha/beta hydrolase [Cellulomonas marina]|uniref:Acetyl esterase/lipase n=1 Tax=Cellulomonas marina TaxID=988821 RepID=A0A1I1AA91_9CELL|nr:alpha/beta hydrolase [Cellulomonas marina]GIG30390.1 acetylesterase [Cellulomonas marina]SFB34894.1 Acetyl esterase/lipase [Cellulomonas marina]